MQGISGVDVYVNMASNCVIPIIKTVGSIIVVSLLHETAAWYYYQYCANKIHSWFIGSSSMCVQAKNLFNFFDDFKSNLLGRISTYIISYRVLGYISG